MKAFDCVNNNGRLLNNKYNNMDYKEIVFQAA